ncbi:MAG TPA: manganese efflux pump MntP family protein [Clostridiales bacterium]|jgi:putative Mn2+ efflux pump MntP|nr:manganese efflux pump MntP family protein [Clostridiales bacterium]
MGHSELLLLALGLSMDAFAVSICKGLSQKNNSYKNMLTAGAFFGGFQAFMPLVGYLLGFGFKDYISAFDHWVAFVLLLIIGLKMIWESRKTACPFEAKPFAFKEMTLMAIATSIDALAVGITFAFLNVNILWAVLAIGLVTFLLSFLGVKIGSVFGSKLNSRAEIIGGLVLMGIGSKILYEHLRM